MQTSTREPISMIGKTRSFDLAWRFQIVGTIHTASMRSVTKLSPITAKSTQPPDEHVASQVTSTPHENAVPKKAKTPQNPMDDRRW